METKKTLPVGIALLTLVLVVGVIVVSGAVSALMILQQQAQTRDAIRIADMARLEAAFALLSFETSSYAQAAQGCAQAGSLVSTCSLARYLPTVGNIKDPGKHTYVISTVPDDSTFGVTFTLERGIAEYAKGSHTLSPQGIR